MKHWKYGYDYNQTFTNKSDFGFGLEGFMVYQPL